MSTQLGPHLDSHTPRFSCVDIASFFGVPNHRELEPPWRNGCVLLISCAERDQGLEGLFLRPQLPLGSNPRYIGNCASKKAARPGWNHRPGDQAWSFLREGDACGMLPRQDKGEAKAILRLAWREPY
jgi:hypothetical protein